MAPLEPRVKPFHLRHPLRSGSIVTGPPDFPSAVLIRAVHCAERSLLLTGPARVTKALKIDKSFYGKPATPESGLWFEDRGEKVGEIIATPRIGVNYAGKEWAGKEWRFVVKVAKDKN